MALLVALGLSGCGEDLTAEQVQQDHRAEALEAEREVQITLEPLANAGELLAEAVRDSCVTGQHNWKIDDPYDVVCTVEVHRAYRVTGGDFRSAADRVTGTFPECASGASEAEETLRDYWDTLEGTQTHNFEGPYRPDYLPDYRLDCDGAGGDTGQDADRDGGERPPVPVTVTGWATLPADGETRRLREHGMGRPCVTSTETQPCEWNGIPALTIFGFDAAQQGWVVFISGTREYARIPDAR